MEEDVRYVSCVGCSFCCRKAPCGVALRIHGNGIRECPELIWTGERYLCRLCTLSGELGASYRKELYIGEGCCCSLNSDRQNIPAPIPTITKPNISRDLLVFLRHLYGSFVSSDAIWLALDGMQRELNLGPEWRDSVMVQLKEHRDSFTEEFMG